MRIRTAVIAVAGYGTRFLPATKAVPKELLPIVDKPIVQYLVEEAVQSGIEDFIFVTRPGTSAIADHFDSSRELEVHLEEQQKSDYLNAIRRIPRLGNFAFVRQARHLPYGNGSPLLTAKHFLARDEPFVYMFGDDLVLSEKPCVQQIVELYIEHQPGAVIAFQEVPREQTSRYGIAKLKTTTKPMEMDSIVEKPAPRDAPSTLAQIGRFVLSPSIIELLESVKLAPGQELYLTDAIDKLCKQNRVLVHAIEGEWLTTGDPLRFLIANIQYALRDPAIGPELAAYLRGRRHPDLSGKCGDT